GPQPDWVHFQGNYIDFSTGLPALPEQDIVIATYYTTIDIAQRIQPGAVIHYCQGYEASYAHLADVAPQIEALYRRPLPAFVVSPHLADLISEQFQRPTFIVSPPLDLNFRSVRRLRPRSVARILVQGIFESTWKNVPIALQAVKHLREMGQMCE
ncbi:MAG: hypothetical protein CUN54_09890, partial [Phototrophicales bacterium]